MRGSVLAATLAVLVGAPLVLGATGYSFDARPGSIYRNSSMATAFPRPTRTVPIEKIVEDRGFRDRGRSYFDEFLGKTCSDVGIFKRCR